MQVIRLGLVILATIMLATVHCDKQEDDENETRRNFELTSATFDRVVNGKKAAFIKFYAPCKNILCKHGQTNYNM